MLILQRLSWRSSFWSGFVVRSSSCNCLGFSWSLYLNGFETRYHPFGRVTLNIGFVRMQQGYGQALTRFWHFGEVAKLLWQSLIAIEVNLKNEKMHEFSIKFWCHITYKPVLGNIYVHLKYISQMLRYRLKSRWTIFCKINEKSPPIAIKFQSLFQSAG